MTENIELEWATLGTKVAVLDRYGASIRNVAKVTATQIVLDDGLRFRKTDCRVVGHNDPWAFSRRIAPLNAPGVADALRRARFRELYQRSESLLRSLTYTSGGYEWTAFQAVIAEMTEISERARNAALREAL